MASLPSQPPAGVTPSPRSWRWLVFCAGVVDILALGLLSGCAVGSGSGSSSKEEYTPGDPAAPSQVTPREALAMARELSNHPWQPFAKNILHGKDKAGVLVNTPDAGFQEQPDRPGWWLPGVVNTGIPYKWGGFDSPASFDAAIAEGLAAGDVSSPEKRRLDNAAVSAQAAGVDCSGFVSRCLRLPTVHDTRQLPALCNVVPNPQELRPGDILDYPGRHAVLCAGWVTPDHQWMYYYETGGPPNYWKPALKQARLDQLMALGYQFLHYRGMATGGQIDGKQVLTRATRTTAPVVAHPVLGEP